MYESFLREYEFKKQVPCGPQERGCVDVFSKIKGLSEFFLQLGGGSVTNGVYRVLCPEKVELWEAAIIAVFPHFSGRILPFGYDWLGRFYCLDFDRQQGDIPLVLLFSHLTNEVLEVPVGLLEFHNFTLVQQKEPALEVGMFSAFLAECQLSALQYDECADLTVPLYLGGAYTVKNMKVLNLATSWEIAAQLATQTASLGEGERVRGVTFKSD